MLRFLYLSLVYLQQREVAHRRPLRRGVEDGEDHEARRRKLKRRIIRRKLGPWTLVASIIADFDVVADWVFYASDVSARGDVMRDIGLAFATLGTFLWFLLVTEGHVVDWGVQLASSLYHCRRDRARRRRQQQQQEIEMPLGILEHIPLKYQMGLNVAFEDVPQLIITLLAEDSVSTAAGSFNVTTAVFSFLAKVADVLEASRVDAPMAVQLRMVDIESGVMETLLTAQDKLEQQEEKSAAVVVALAGLARDSEVDCCRNAFRVLQLAPQHVDIVARRFKGRHFSIEREWWRVFDVAYFRVLEVRARLS